MARAEYTTGYSCDVRDCPDPALHDIDVDGNGYQHYCTPHAACVVQNTWPDGLPVQTGAPVAGIHRA